tara:strand:- start:1931 stop:3061 length:1131 start_codon:yes stop_codon:yes gene_type:complete
MNTISRLEEVYEKIGKDSFVELLKGKITISEKVSGTRIEMQKIDEVKFYSKGELSVVDRTMISLYENPIKILEESSSSISIPTKYRLGFRYINESSDLILTDIKVLNSKGKSKAIISDKTTLSKWSRKLGLDFSKPLFEGYLNKDQIESISDILETSKEPFSSILSIINKKESVSGELILKIINESGKSTTVKTIDPDLKHSKEEGDHNLIKSDRSASDMASISIMDMLEYMMINGFDKYQLTDENRDQRYLDLISLVFVDYLKRNEGKFEDVDFNKAEFSKLDEFKVNTKFVKIEELKNILTVESHSDLFKIMLGTFRKIRKNPTAIIDRNIMEKVNSMIILIDKKIEFNEPVKESDDVPSFEEYLKKKQNKTIL